MIDLFKEVATTAKDLQTIERLTGFESLKIAAMMQQNRILSDTFMINVSRPNVLEAIGMQLGMTSGSMKDITLPDSIGSVGDSIQSLADKINDIVIILEKEITSK